MSWLLEHETNLVSFYHHHLVGYRYRAISGMRKLSKPKEKTIVHISKGDEKCPLRKTKNKNKKQKIKVKGKLKK